MSSPVDRAAARNKRKTAKGRNDGPLLRLVQEEVTRKPVKASVKELKPLTDNQALYDALIRSKTIVFSTGPAGTGKTFFGATRAAEMLKAGSIERIIVTRPALGVDEELGFLPGEIDEKYEPYFRPVRDALVQSFGSGHLEYLLKAGVIEARPLGLLRGASIDNTWVLADEMQNATKKQMEMLLTRIGKGSKFLINGDLRQTDLPSHTESGLSDAVRRLAQIDAIGMVHFTVDDIVRSGICREIVMAYNN